MADQPRTFSLPLIHIMYLATSLRGLLPTMLVLLVAALPARIESHDDTAHEFAPELSNDSVATGISFNFTDVTTPEPVRGDFGTPSLIEENDQMNAQNPDAWAPPQTDEGTVYQG